MPRSKLSADRTAERRKRVAGYRLSGATVTEIAKFEAVHKSTISRDAKAIRKEWQEHRLQAFEAMQDLENRRLDVLLNAVWEKAVNGSLDHVDRALTIIRERRRLLGLDAPVKAQVEDVTPVGHKAALLKARLSPEAADALDRFVIAMEAEDNDDGVAPPVVA